jgi:hypothetical protein
LEGNLLLAQIRLRAEAGDKERETEMFLHSNDVTSATTHARDVAYLPVPPGTAEFDLWVQNSETLGAQLSPGNNGLSPRNNSFVTS